MSKCMQHNTIKVPQGNAWQLLLPLKTAHWSGDDLVAETIDYRALEDVQVLIDGVVWEDWQMTEDGPLCNIPADMPLGPHNTVITATYVGVEVKAAYFENFTIVAWSFESNVGEHLLDAPLVSDAAFIYVGITDDEELEELKQQLRNAIAETENARLAYEAAKEEFDEKAEDLDDIATNTALANHAVDIENGIIDWATSIVNSRSLPYSIVFNGDEYHLADFMYHQGHPVVYWAGTGGIGDIYTANWDYARIGDDVYSSPNLDREHRIGTISAVNKVTLADIYDRIGNIDFSTLAKEQTLTNGIQSILTALNPKATKDDVTAAKQAILDALSHISPTDPNSLALAQFFGVTLLEGYEFMTDTEVCDELEDIMQVIDPTLTAAQAAAITEQTLNPSES